MKILILCDHYPLSPRVVKIRNSIIKLNPTAIVKICAWNRENSVVVEEYVLSYNQKLEYGNKIKKLFNIFKYIKYAKKISVKFNPDFIHVIDFEMLISSLFLLNKSKIVYEVYDIKSFENGLVNNIREKLELMFIKKYISNMILASPFFEKYYQKSGFECENVITINNKPSRVSYNEGVEGYMYKYRKKLKNKLVIGFIGTIRYEEILFNLIDAASNLTDIVILLAGDGPSYSHIEKYIIKNDIQEKVIMTGRYSSLHIEEIYEACDYIWAAYPNKSLNVKYAISNKFFESLIYKKQVIVSEQTMIGNHIDTLKEGLTVNPYSVSSIENLLLMLLNQPPAYTESTFGEGLYWEDEEYRLSSIYK